MTRTHEYQPRVIRQGQDGLQSLTPVQQAALDLVLSQHPDATPFDFMDRCWTTGKMCFRLREPGEDVVHWYDWFEEEERWVLWIG